VEHRFASDHHCPVQETLEPVPTKPSGGSGHRLGTNKKPIQLSKVALHVDDQWHLHVAVIPKQIECHVIGNRKWGVGKTVDAIVDAVPAMRGGENNGRWRLARWDVAAQSWAAVDTLSALHTTVPQHAYVLAVPEVLLDKSTARVNILPSLLPRDFANGCSATARQEQEGSDEENGVSSWSYMQRTLSRLVK
jgi:hypothetical protein